MSIYPVRLSEWYSPPSEQFETCFAIIKFSRCFACGKKLRFKSAVGYHSVPWGHGDVYCSWECCRSGKQYKPDKRQNRRRWRHAKKFKYIDLLRNWNGNI